MNTFGFKVLAIFIKYVILALPINILKLLIYKLIIMKTDVKLYKKVKVMLLVLIILSFIFAEVSFFVGANEAFYGSVIVILIFTLILLVNVLEYRHHVILVKRHGLKSPREIVEWLVSAYSSDQGAFLDYLDSESCKIILDELDKYIAEHPEENLWELYREVASKF